MIFLIFMLLFWTENMMLMKLIHGTESWPFYGQQNKKKDHLCTKKENGHFFFILKKCFLLKSYIVEDLPIWWKREVIGDTVYLCFWRPIMSTSLLDISLDARRQSENLTSKMDHLVFP